MRIPLIVALIALVGIRVADASCGTTYPALSPANGAHLPPHATIYLFDTEAETDIYDALTITSADDATGLIKFRAVKLARNGDYTVHRIELRFVALGDRPIQVYWKGRLLATYVIADDGEPDHARVVDVIHHAYQWTCSFADVIQVAVEGNAIAYQIEWEDDRTTVVADEHLLRSGKVGDHSVFELGHPDCMSYNIEPELLATPRSFELYALFADGMVKRIGSSIAQLDEHSVRLPVELIRGADVRIPRSFSVAVTTSPDWVFASGAAGGLAGGIVVFVVGRRRRRLAELERLAPMRRVR